MEDVSSTSLGDIENTPLATASIPVAAPDPSDVVHEGDAALIVTIWDESNSTVENINAFLTRWPPSRTPSDYCNWIAVDRGGHQRALPDIAGLTASFESLKSSENVTVDEIDRIAAAHGVLSGKWLIYAEPEEIDELWGDVVRLLCLVLKKGSMKVSPKQEGEPHVICIYADDYRNATDVGALRDSLRSVGVEWRIGFKPDAYTHLGIYARNPWHIRPSRYFS